MSAFDILAKYGEETTTWPDAVVATTTLVGLFLLAGFIIWAVTRK